MYILDPSVICLSNLLIVRLNTLISHIIKIREIKLGLIVFLFIKKKCETHLKLNK